MIRLLVWPLTALAVLMWMVMLSCVAVVALPIAWLVDWANEKSWSKDR